ncbi:rifin, putative [Plasmodium sp. DRC-Itaito]|nr:rifin, putative [Plasmodium sp. DRC-Itaito]
MYHIIILYSYNYLTYEVLHINENEAQTFKMLLSLFLLNKLLLLLLLKYKEQYYNDIKEIILKDTIQKQLTKQLSSLEKFTDIDDLSNGINEKKVATKVKKGKKSKKTLGHTLTEWNILPNIDMYEWIPFSSKEAIIVCNIKNMKHAITKVGDDITSNGSNFKNSSVSSIFIYALWEFFEHIVAPVSAALFFEGSSNENGSECTNVSHIHGSGDNHYITKFKSEEKNEIYNIIKRIDM